MALWIAILLGLVQGVFMFLPVSSTSHLALSQHWLADSGFELPPADSSEMILFDLVLHAGTVVSILWVFRRKLSAALVRSVNEASQGRWGSPTLVAGFLVLVAAATTGVIGLGVRAVAPDVFGDPRVIAGLLVLTGLILWWTDRAPVGLVSARHLTVGVAVAVGIAQAVALLPGLSRSGLTIAMGLAVGLGRRESAEFSFVLAIPTILVATTVQWFDVAGLSLPEGIGWGALVVGFVVAAATGVGALLLVLRLLYAARFRIFTWYVWALALVVLATGVAE